MHLHTTALAVARYRPLATCIATLLGLSSPAALATNRPVTSCLDDNSTPGTLRDVIKNVALSGDVVDLSALSCPGSVITLQTGGENIAVNQNTLTIKGPGAGSLTIDGTLLNTYYKNYSNVFTHFGTDKLTIEALRVTGGHVSHKNIPGLGGCVYSTASVSIKSSILTSCSAYSQNYSAKGGAIYAKGDVDLTSSTISDSSATGNSADGGGIAALGKVTLTLSSVTGNTLTSGGSGVRGGGIRAGGGVTLNRSVVSDNMETSSSSGAYGGGVSADGDVSLLYATIDGNDADGNGFSQGAGGGIYASGNVTIANSTISNNTSHRGAGVRMFSGAPGNKTLAMRNSTISGNFANGGTGGLYTNAATVLLSNSTVAFNSSGSGATAAGIVLNATLSPVLATLQSMLVSNNEYAGNDFDLSAVNSGSVTFNAGPANNLIRSTTVGNLPGDTVFGTCPLLGPLRANGGLTLTHALWSTSIAIDNGNNVSLNPDTLQPYVYDQRGSAAVNGALDYLRVSGPKADIGAYEVQKAEIVFGAGFESCVSINI